MFGVVLPPIPIPAIQPLVGRASVFTFVAAGTGQTNVSGFMVSTLTGRNDMIDGKRVAVKALAVSAKSALGGTHMLEFLGCECATVAFLEGAAALAGSTVKIDVGGTIGALISTSGIGMGGLIGALPLADVFSVGGIVGVLPFADVFSVGGIVGALPLADVFGIGNIVLSYAGFAVDATAILFAFLPTEGFDGLGELAFGAALIQD
jgi:hypothetical protein